MGGANPEVLDREWLQELLGGVVESTYSLQRVREAIRRVIIGDAVEVAECDLPLILRIVQDLDAAEDADSLLRVCQDFNALLKTVSSSDDVLLLLDIVRERDLAVDVLGKYRRRQVSRTQLISFLTNRVWSKESRIRILALDDAELDAVINNLRGRKFRSVADVLLDQ